ncbi:trigger factor [Candidatus Kaiserbacteria bacterium]|nr:trigger factor [Candidatus Kaiserbacteria bacterium]
MDFIKQYTVEKEAKSQVKITGEIPFSELEKERTAAIKRCGQDLKVDGFRPGHVPEKVVVERVGEMTVLSEMAERALAKIYPLVLKEHNIDAIGYPQINITKIAKDNPLGFTFTVATLPEITLPDFKTLAKTTNQTKTSTEVTDEDLEKQIVDIQRQKRAYEKLQAKAVANEQTEHVHDENCDHDHDETKDLPTLESEAYKTAVDEDDTKEEPLPELTDEYVKTLGQPGQFETVADFKAKLKEHLALEKEQEVKATHRAKITDSIIEASELELPQVLVDSELEQMFAQMTEDLARSNLRMDDYLGHIKKTKEDLKKEWTPAAEKRAKLQLILNEIAKTENIKADDTLVENQVKQLLEQYKDADPARVKIYVESILQNEAVMKMLEEA